MFINEEAEYNERAQKHYVIFKAAVRRVLNCSVGSSDAVIQQLNPMTNNPVELPFE